MNIPPGQDQLLDSKRAYLNWHFFLVRAIFYFVFFIGAALAVPAFLDRARIGTAIPAFTLKMRKLGFVGAAALRALAHLRRLRLADGPELPMVLHHVGRLHFRRRGGQLDVAARARHHRAAQGRLLEGDRHDRALPHHGEVDARLHRLLGLHRLQPIHAHLVCEHPGRDANISSGETPSRGTRSIFSW